MNDLSENVLKKMISEVVSGVPSYYRCYELMRRLKEVFKQKGIKFEVRDGSVLYCPTTLLQEASNGNCKMIVDASVKYEDIMVASKLAAEKAKEKDLLEVTDWKIVILHSWGILPREKCLVDCHAVIDLSKFQDSLLFDEFPVLREITFENLIRVVPFQGLIGRSGKYHLGNDIFMEIATQKGNTIKYKYTDYSVELRM